MAEVCPVVVSSRIIACVDRRVSCGLRALRQVSAHAADYGLTLGQRVCAEKSNEVTAIAELLPTLALEGAVVTIDAMGCQTAPLQGRSPDWAAITCSP